MNAPLPSTEPTATRSQLLVGQAAAPGLVLGKLVALPAPTPPPLGSTRAAPADAGGNEPLAVHAILVGAIDAAVAQIEALAARTRDEQARSILQFHIEFLGDQTLLEPALVRLREGASAVAAWCAAIDAQIADFETAADDYFRHRAADLHDMRARVLAILAGEVTDALALPANAILIADDLPPSRFLATDWQAGQGVALRGGSATAHVALLARGRGVPMVVGIGAAEIGIGSEAILDGDRGTLEIVPDARQIAALAQRQGAARAESERDTAAALGAARTANGEAVQVLLNVSSLEELDRTGPEICDGVGLVRSELLFAHGPPDEETQLRFYRRILDWAQARPVIIRTLDAGGDKPIAGVTIDGETNPFLGVRGVRLSLAGPDVFKVQLRALLRAATHGNLRLMVPMVTATHEMIAVRELLAQAAAELRNRAVAYALPPLGIMVEVPAAALALDMFDVDFASIGSNDLLQYTMAAGRDNERVAPLADADHPAFARLLKQVVRAAAQRGMSLSLCGDLAAQSKHTPLLLACGLRALSMPAAAVGRVKRAIAAWSLTHDEQPHDHGRPA